MSMSMYDRPVLPIHLIPTSQVLAKSLSCAAMLLVFRLSPSQPCSFMRHSCYRTAAFFFPTTPRLQAGRRFKTLPPPLRNMLQGARVPSSLHVHTRCVAIGLSNSRLLTCWHGVPYGPSHTCSSTPSDVYQQVTYRYLSATVPSNAEARAPAGPGAGFCTSFKNQGIPVRLRQMPSSPPRTAPSISIDILTGEPTVLQRLST